MIDGFGFDLDGTLIYTPFEFRYLILNKTLKRFELKVDPESDKKLIDDFWFNHRRNEIIQKHFNIDPKDFWAEYKKHDTVDFRGEYAAPYEDTGFIKKLKEMGKKTGIVTGAPVHIANFEIGLIGRELFDSVVFARLSEGIKPKPDTESLFRCIEELGVDKNRFIYVGNSEDDIMMGRDARVPTVYMDRGEYEISKKLDTPFKIYSLPKLETFII